ncbi:MAG: cyclic nucleotide-binding domain-containing protein, partial [Bdellovibrionota bacterium]
ATLFLDDSDLLADSRHVKLAEALRPEHVWSRTFMLVPFIARVLTRERRLEKKSIEVSFLAVALISLGFAALERAVSASVLGDGEMRSPFELWLGIVLAFSIGRTVRSLAELAMARSQGRIPSIEVGVDLLSVSVATNTTANGATLFGFIASLAAIGLCAVTGIFDRGSGVFAFTAILAVFAEASPFAKSAMTDAIKSLYTSLGDSRADGRAEGFVRKLHVAGSFLWCIALAAFTVFAIPALAIGWKVSFFATTMVGKIALLIGASKVLGLYAGWLEDVVGSFSYDDVDSRAVRRLWRRRPVRLAAFGESAVKDLDLESLPLLRQIDGETRRRLLAKAKVRQLNEREAATKQGEVDRVLYVVLEGRMAVAKRFSVGRGSSRKKVVAILEPGSVFGEAAFFFGHERTADVVALEPSKVLAIPHDPSMKTLETDRGVELQTRIWFLQALVSGSFLKEIPTEALDAVIHSGRVLRVPAGNRVIQEGEAADSCYFIVQGQASVTQKTKLINKMGAGDAFGEIALLQKGLLRTASVHADSELLLIMIDSTTFWSLLRSHLPLALEIERLARLRLTKDRERQQDAK